MSNQLFFWLSAIVGGAVSGVCIFARLPLIIRWLGVFLPIAAVYAIVELIVSGMTDDFKLAAAFAATGTVTAIITKRVKQNKKKRSGASAPTKRRR